MAITVTTDPILDVAEAQDILKVDDRTELALLINGVSAKFLRHTGRVQINYDGTNAITEKIKAIDPLALYLHASPVTADETHDVVVEVYTSGVLQNTYKYSDDEVIAYGDDQSAWLELANSGWPHPDGREVLHVTYFAGFATVPGDVTQGAIMQAKADLRRMEGEVGITSKSYEGESTSYDNAGIIKTVRDLWQPYRIMI